MIMLRDATYKDIVTFFEACEKHGKNIPTVITHVTDELNNGLETNTVSHEARKLKSIFLRLRDW